MTKNNNTKFVKIELPNHSNELSKTEDAINDIKLTFKTIKESKKLNNEIHTKLFDKVLKILFYLGKLSKPVFDVEFDLELIYIKQYPNSPDLAKKLWIDHYEEIHHPYSILKNRCFKLLDELDDEYINIHKKYPPNWNENIF